MQALRAAVIVMGVLIVAGVAVLAVTLVRRVGAVAAAPSAASLHAVIDEPEGTRIAAASLSGERLVLQLSGGGGPDRVVVYDLAQGRIAGRVALAH